MSEKAVLDMCKKVREGVALNRDSERQILIIETRERVNSFRSTFPFRFFLKPIGLAEAAARAKVDDYWDGDWLEERVSRVGREEIEIVERIERTVDYSYTGLVTVSSDDVNALWHYLKQKLET